jgi:hypothetical protein
MLKNMAQPKEFELLTLGVFFPQATAADQASLKLRKDWHSRRNRALV